MTRQRVLVVGGGVAGLSTALALSCHGYLVELFEGAESLGGKAAEASYGDLRFDTGPSVLTLPEVFDELFRRAGTSLADRVELRRPSPNFRYLYPSGVELDVAFELEETRKNVEVALGSKARDELDRFLGVAAQIWENARRYFIFAEAPDIWGLLRGGPSSWLAIGKIDGMRTMQAAIEDAVKTPELRTLLKRYATYNGSDVRRAPATLNCIAHVELALGGYGIQGGMVELVLALVALLNERGVVLHTSSPVERLEFSSGTVRGVFSQGRLFSADAVVFCGEASKLGELGVPMRESKSSSERSMSGYTAVFSAKEPPRPRAAHTVLFPNDYLSEFREIFDGKRVPVEPTVYLCAQSRCHGRTVIEGREALFAMVNAPALTDASSLPSSEEVFEQVRGRLVERGLLSSQDKLVWTRAPRELAERFPGSDGALYGLASNDKWSAFQRRGSRLKGARGVYFAHGSGHPGGGLPLVAQAGILAADAVREDLGI